MLQQRCLLCLQTPRQESRRTQSTAAGDNWLAEISLLAEMTNACIHRSCDRVSIYGRCRHGRDRNFTSFGSLNNIADGFERSLRSVTFLTYLQEERAAKKAVDKKELQVKFKALALQIGNATWYWHVCLVQNPQAAATFAALNH